MSSLEENCTVKILDKEFKITYPTVSEYLNIQSRKMLLSNSQYDDLITRRSHSVAQAYYLDLIAALSTFVVLIPNLEKSTGIENVMELDSITAKKIVVAYKTQFLPWYDKVQKVLYDLDLIVEANEDEPKG